MSDLLTFCTNHHFSIFFQQNGDQYFVLLIITDGIITDMEATKYAIINACGKFHNSSIFLRIVYYFSIYFRASNEYNHSWSW